MSMVDYEPCWYWIREREAIRVRKEEDCVDPPWTDDPILAKYRFCNVRREDDRVTRWIADNIREPYAEHEHLWLMCCAARQINWPGALEELIGSDGWYGTCSFSPENMARVLNERAARGDKVFTGAYIITAPSTKGNKKTDHVALNTLGALWRDRECIGRLMREPGVSLRRVHSKLMEYNGWGPFMAYQAVIDMIHTPILFDAPDRETWAAAGPGTIRGLNRTRGRALDASLSQDRALAEIRETWKVVREATDVEMEFSDVTGLYCEVDKFLRVRNGEGAPRALYVPGRGS